MAKRLDLSAEILSAPVTPPKAARVAIAAANPAPSPKVQHVPLQIRIPRADAKAIKTAALDAEQTIGEFMLACFHAYMQACKKTNGGS